MDKKRVNALSKEDDIYYEGPFWIIADSVREIYQGKFEIVGEVVAVDYNGNYMDETLKKKGATSHRKLWKESGYSMWNETYEYNHFPRGRVRIHDGEVYVHINSKMNTPRIINAIVKEYNLYKFGNDINIEEDDLLQGSHYEFLLK